MLYCCLKVEEAMKDQALDLSDDPAAAPLKDPAKDLSEDVAAAAEGLIAFF